MPSHVDHGLVVVPTPNGDALLTRQDAGKFTLARCKDMELSVGDRIRFRQNYKGAGINNGDMGTVERVTKEGNIVYRDDNGKQKQSPASPVVQRGYAVTSYASQGKTVDHVIVSDSACKAATNRKEYFVSLSRGKQSVAIVTADRATLREHVGQLGVRPLASELRPKWERTFADRTGNVWRRGRMAADKARELVRETAAQVKAAAVRTAEAIANETKRMLARLRQLHTVEVAAPKVSLARTHQTQARAARLAEKLRSIDNAFKQHRASQQRRGIRI